MTGHPHNHPRLVAHNLHKSFKLPHERHTSLKQAALNWQQRSYEEFEVLKNINFEVRDGEFFGIVGKNGSGKSTLLKLIAQIYQPTSGGVTVHGKLTPFIELGVGFNMELSGRDNVFLYGAILGLTQKQIAAKYDDIVAFSELERFMDQKLKNYSSGMQVRLAFSIAIQAYSDILLFDEVLAVGDAAFQKKCMDVFNNIKKEKKTVILVTHDMNAVQRFCDRAMLIDKGEIVAIGDSSEVAEAYNNLNMEQNPNAARDSLVPPAIAVTSCQTLLDGKPKRTFRPGQQIGIRVVYTAAEAVDNPYCSVSVKDPSGRRLFTTGSKLKKQSPGTVQPGQVVTMDVIIDNIFANGEYSIAAAAANSSGAKVYHHKDDMLRFSVTGRETVGGLVVPEHELDLKVS